MENSNMVQNDQDFNKAVKRARAALFGTNSALIGEEGIQPFHVVIASTMSAVDLLVSIVVAEFPEERHEEVLEGMVDALTSDMRLNAKGALQKSKTLLHLLRSDPEVAAQMLGDALKDLQAAM